VQTRLLATPAVKEINFFIKQAAVIQKEESDISASQD
jgi:hypothetical protein